MRILTGSALLWALLSSAASNVRAAGDDSTEVVFARDVQPFLKQHCYTCHDAREARAGFRIDQLADAVTAGKADFLQGKTADHWQEVMHNLNSGAMPPKDEPRPNADRSFAVVKWIAAQLQQAEKTAKQAGGRIPMRRLNRDEYANTIRDLFALDAKLLAPIVEDLPGDGKAEGFDRLGVALFFDQTQIERSLAAAEKIADLAIVTPQDAPPVVKTRYEAELDRKGGMGVRKVRTTEVNDFVKDQKVEIAGGPQRYEFRKDGVMYVQGYGTNRRGSPFSRMANVAVDELIPEDGYYRIRVRCGADRGDRNEPMQLQIAYNYGTPQEHTQQLDITASTQQPGVFETVMFIRRGTDDQRRRITLLFNELPRYIMTTPEYNQFRQDTVGTAGKIRQALQAGDKQEVARLEALLKDARKRALAWKGPARHINPKLADVEPPRFFLDGMEFEGPLRKEWPPRSHKQLLFDGDDRQDMAYAKDIFARFLPRAYRRPVTDAERERVLQLVEQEWNSSGDFYKAIRLGVQHVLTSPGFLFLQEPAGITDAASDTTKTPRPLGDYELASRLSYFLWSTMPDEELFRLAAAGTLKEPAVLRSQVTRLLADAKSREFVENFGGQWLNVREFGSVEPATEYQDYDAELEEASKREAHEFVAEVVVNNLPITTFLDSDFVVINERLARHYGIEGVSGDEFRRVPVTPEHHRGGVLGMAGLLTLLADGTRTLPVRRAAWVVTNLFNDPPPPPPPNAGEVQPNTAGEKLTVRERLQRHRDEPTCASCHRTLDPYGLALENYDAIGMWRTRQNGEGFRRKAPELDVSGTLPDGHKFTTLGEFKTALLADKDRFARAFSERLLTYALCRPVGYTDRTTVDALQQTLKENEYRIQPLIHAIVVSEPFLTK